MVLRKTYENRNTGQILVSIPKGQGINPGDVVEIKKVDNDKRIVKDGHGFYFVDKDGKPLY